MTVALVACGARTPAPSSSTELEAHRPPETQPVMPPDAGFPRGGGEDIPLQQFEILSALHAVQPKVHQCAQLDPKLIETVKVKITVSELGLVTNVAPQPPLDQSPAAACVRRVFEGVRFRGNIDQITFQWPFRL
jgi:hypothetical protein